MTDHTHPLENVAQTMRDTVQALTPAEVLNPAETAPAMAPVLFAMPKDKMVHDLTEKYRAAAQFFKPLRRKGVAKLADLQSLIAWANRFKGETSVLFANPNMTAPTLTCIANYHAEGVPNPEGDAGATHCDHLGIYAFPLTEEWKAWTKVSDKPLDKDAMGEFIEACAKDVLDPTPNVISGVVSDTNQIWENRLIETAQKIEGRFGQLSQLLAMSKQFQIHETSNLSVVTNRDTGEAQIQFTNTHNAPDGRPMSLPNLIIIAIPVFVGGAPYRMAVRFRYRKMGGEVKFILSIYNPEKVFEAAFNEAVELAKTGTDLPAFLGTPES